MTKPPTCDEDAALWRQWFAAAADPAVDAKLRALWAKLQAEIDAKQPVCEASGRCCRFEEFGHRLYVTGLEAAWTVGNSHRATEPPSHRGEGGDGVSDGVQSSRIALPQLVERDPGGCPYQVEGLCSVHPVRPLGCRIYFCDGSDDWQHAQYEHFLQALHEIHEAHGLPYRYMEWRQALRAAGAA